MLNNKEFTSRKILINLTLLQQDWKKHLFINLFVKIRTSIDDKSCVKLDGESLSMKINIHNIWIVIKGNQLKTINNLIKKNWEHIQNKLFNSAEFVYSFEQENFDLMRINLKIKWKVVRLKVEIIEWRYLWAIAISW